jgi:hypothetical protein
MANTRVTNPVTDFDKSTSLPGLKLPSGTNANQPSGVQGMIRNDTGETTGSSASAIEHHNGTKLQSLLFLLYPKILIIMFYILETEVQKR